MKKHQPGGMWKDWIHDMTSGVFIFIFPLTLTLTLTDLD